MPTYDVAGLNIAITSSDAVSAKRNLKGLEAQGYRTEKSIGSLTATAGKMAAAFLSFEAARRGATYAVNAFSVLDKGLIGIRKTTGIVGDDLRKLGEDIQAIGMEVPVATEELLNIAQAAGQLGVSGSANILKFTKTVGMMGVASDLAGEEAAMTLARLLTVTGETADQVDVLGSVIVALGNNMAATEKEIAWMATQVAQATSVFGVSSAEAVALGAAMRSIGVRAELGGSAVGRAMRAMDKSIRGGGEAFVALQKLTGMTAEELSQTFEKDAVAAFVAFEKGIQRVNAAGGDVTATLKQFGLAGEEILKVIPALANASGELDRALGIANNELQHATALTDEAVAASESFSAQMTLTGNELDIYAARLGKSLVPAIRWVAKETVQLVEEIDTLGGYIARQMAIFDEFRAGRLGFFDREMWDDEAAKEYLESLTAVSMAERRLKELKESGVPLFEKERQERARAISQQEMVVEVLKEEAYYENLNKQALEASAKALENEQRIYENVARAISDVNEITKEVKANWLTEDELMRRASTEKTAAWASRRGVNASDEVAQMQTMAQSEREIYAELMQDMRGYEMSFSETQAHEVMKRVEMEKFAAEETAQSFREIETIISDAFDGAADALTDFVVDGKANFSDLTRSILKDIVRMQIQSNVTKPLASGFSSFIGSFFGSAHGNVFSGGDISRYSNSVVTQPTFFSGAHNKAYASGGNVMGEAGPEAILPLTRTSSGDLGVKAQSSAPQINFTVIDNAGVNVQTEQTPTSDGGMNIAVMLDKQNAANITRPGSATRRAMAAAQNPYISRG